MQSQAIAIQGSLHQAANLNAALGASSRTADCRNSEATILDGRHYFMS